MKDELGTILSPDSFEKRFKEPETLEVLSPKEFVRQTIPSEEEKSVYSPEDFVSTLNVPVPSVASKEKRPFLPEAISGIPAGITSSIEMYGRAGSVLGIPGSDWLVDVGKELGEPFEATRRELLPEAVRSGIESTIQSILAGIPGAVVGGTVGSLVPGAGTVAGGIAGYATSAGTIFGLAEYHQFLEEVEQQAIAGGATPEEVKVLRDQMKDRALISALAEGGFEAVSDLLQAKILKLAGSKVVTGPIKKALVKGTFNYFGKMMPVELASELATTAVQVSEREKAGIPTAGMAESLKRTVGPVIVQSLLRAKGGVMLAHRLAAKGTPATFSGYQEDPETGQKFGMYNLNKDMGEYKKGDTVTAAWLRDRGVQVEDDPADKIDDIIKTFEDAQERVDNIPAFNTISSVSKEAEFVPIVDAESGVPITVDVFHGTNKVFDRFDFERAGANFNEFDKGAFFTNSKDFAKRFAKGLKRRNGGEEIVKRAQISFKNPLVIDLGKEGKTSEDLILQEGISPIGLHDLGPEITDRAIKGKHDGIIIINEDSAEPSLVITLDPNSIKLVQKSIKETDAWKAQALAYGATSVDENMVSILKNDIPNLAETDPRSAASKLAVLSGALKRNVHYDTERGLVVDEPTDEMYERIIRAIEPNDKEKIAFARSQVDQSKWLRYFTGEGEEPDIPAHNVGEDLNNSVLSEEKEQKETTDQEIQSKITKGADKHVTWIARHILSPERTLRGTTAAKNAAAVIEGELYLTHINHWYETWYKKLMHGLNKTEREQVRTAMELTYKIKDAGGTLPGIAHAKNQLVELYTKYPRIQKAIDGVGDKGGIIDLFEYIKKRYQNAMVQVKLMKFSPEETQVFNEIRGGAVEGAVIDSIKRNLDIEGMARKETDKGLGEGTWIKLTEKKKEKKRNRIIKREVNRMSKEAEEIDDIKKWGLRDYITNIELGSYRILDSEGNTLGFGRTAKEAKAKAYQIRTESAAKGVDIGKLNVEASFSPINPTVKREEVLAGMKDIFEVLPRYVYSMEKRIIMQPIIAQYKQDVKNNPQDYPLDVKNVIQQQINYVMGAKYSWGDMIWDDIATRFGWKTGRYSRSTALIRRVVTNLKLGYRPSSAVINALGGFGNTWVAVGNRFFTEASRAIKSGTYTTSDGEVVDLKKKLFKIENKGLLGIDFSVGADGTINTRVPIWHPLGMFQMAERYIRPHGFVANYIYQREHLGKNDFEATEAALLNLRFQNFTYNLSALPATLRSPTSKVIGQFKSYLVKELEFMSTLRGMQIPRMVGLQLMMAGPRGAIYLLRSIPILGALGLLNDWEKWLVKKKGLAADIATRGIGGVVGGDISAPAVFQLPGRPEDWGGPFVGDAVRLFRDVIIPAISSIGKGEKVAYLEEDAINWIASLSPLLYYWRELEQSLLFWDDLKTGDFKGAAGEILKNYRKPNIWVRDSSGNKAYQVGGLQDRLLLLAGVPPVSKTQYQVLKRIWRHNERVRRENRTKWYNKVTKKLLREEEIDQDLWQDAILYGVNPNYLPDAIKFKEMTPQQRETLRANLFEKAEALDHFGIE